MPVPTCTQCLPSVPLASFSAASAAVNGRSPLSTSALLAVPSPTQRLCPFASRLPCSMPRPSLDHGNPAHSPKGAPVHHLPPAGSRCRPLSSSTTRASPDGTRGQSRARPSPHGGASGAGNVPRREQITIPPTQRAAESLRHISTNTRSQLQLNPFKGAPSESRKLSAQGPDVKAEAHAMPCVFTSSNVRLSGLVIGSISPVAADIMATFDATLHTQTPQPREVGSMRRLGVPFTVRPAEAGKVPRRRRQDEGSGPPLNCVEVGSYDISYSSDLFS